MTAANCLNNLPKRYAGKLTANSAIYYLIICSWPFHKLAIIVNTIKAQNNGRNVSGENDRSTSFQLGQNVFLTGNKYTQFALLHI